MTPKPEKTSVNRIDIDRGGLRLSIRLAIAAVIGIVLVACGDDSNEGSASSGFGVSEVTVPRIELQTFVSSASTK